MRIVSVSIPGTLLFLTHICYDVPMNKRKIICGVTAMILIIILLLFRTQIQDCAKEITNKLHPKENVTQNVPFEGICAKQFRYYQMIGSGEILAYAPEFTEDDVYTFLQGPKAWGNGVPWSGEWCQEYAKGQYFGSFGCGFCCIANLYCTFSGYLCSPLDVYKYAGEVTGYAPARASAAIDWGNMKVLLQKMGFQCDVYYKPDSYEDFQEQIKNCKSAIVLVCSANDDTFWKNIPGHYVTISLYDETKDDVFLGEPGSPTKNRTRIPLKYVYDALKTTSKFQYLTVDAYASKDNRWKHDGIQEQWNRP